MPISLNALLNVPTREEKSRTKLAEKAAIDRIAEMQLADELARGRAEFASTLGLNADDEAFRRAMQREAEAMRTAGDPTPEVTAARGKVSGLKKQANEWLEAHTGGLLGLPQRRAEAARGEADAAAIKAANAAEFAMGQAPAAGLLGSRSSIADLAKMNLGIEQAEADRGSLPAKTAAERAGYAMNQLTAEEFAANAPLRKQQNDLAATTAEGRMGLLRQIADDPLWNTIINSGINPEVLGFGTDRFGISRPLPLPGGKPAVQSQPIGLLQGGGLQGGKPKSSEERLRELLQNLPLVD